MLYITNAKVVWPVGLCLFSGDVPFICYEVGIPGLGNLLSSFHKEFRVVEDF